MPIYEYRCNQCKKRVTLLILSRSTQARCSHCGGSDLTRLFSRFAAPKSEEARMESLSDPAKWGDIGDENDPASMVKFMKKMGREYGDELGEDFEQELESAAEEAAHGGPAEGETLPPESPESPES
ncbi:MAG: zinc ribbon domain-containing protein [Nitrospirae bacterium]|nr:zinc ribbon domain-containing protein [Nitrospirota bacterium]